MFDSIDKLMSTGAKSAFNKDTPVGTRIEGTIISAMERQVTNFSTKAPEFWDDGSPKMQVVVSIQTGQRVDAEDDGARSIYIKSWGKDKIAFIDAVRNAGFDKASLALAPGNIFRAAFIGTEPSTRGNDKKIYAYQIERGANVPALDANPFATPAAAPAPAPVANPFGAPQPAPQPVQSAPAPVQQVPADPWAAQPAVPAPAPVPAFAAPQPAAPTPTPVAQPAIPAPQPVAQPAAPTENPVVGLIKQGLTNEQIGNQMSMDPSVVQIVRSQLAG